ncbi:MAG: iron-sulfur cluster assembly scaffold protein [Thermoplasmata archaeon]|nr:iron-sulfur cluster assembly scaffold protein [Thermoplasmata archaeon]
MVYRYTEKVIEHFRNPHNTGKIEDADAVATEGSMACGDVMTIYIKEKDGVIEDIKFESYGCAANIATASMVTDIVKGKSLEEAEKLSWKDIVEELGGLPAIKYHCSNLAVDTLHSAIRTLREKKGGKLSKEG